MVSAIETVMAVLLGLLISALAATTAAPLVTQWWDNQATQQAFQITQQVTSAIELLSAQQEDGFVVVKLPKGECVLRFYIRQDYTYVEAEGKAHDVSAWYGLFTTSNYPHPLEVTSSEIPCSADVAREVRIERVANKVKVVA